MTLYEVTNDLLRLMEMAEDPDISPEVLADTMDAVEGAFEVKAEGYAKVLRMLGAQEDCISKEVERLEKRQKTIAKNRERIRERLKEAMESTGKKTIKTDLFTLTVKKNQPSLKIDRNEDIPQEYLIPQPPKVDNKSIKEDVLKGAKYDWCHIEQGTSLTIR